MTRVLWVGTKPPFPPLDGGRRLSLETLGALAAAGARVTIVAPGDPDPGGEAQMPFETVLVPRRCWDAVAFLGRAVLGTPLSIARHTRTGVSRAVLHLLEQGRFDVVHAEQLQALPQCLSATLYSLPLVLRCQNVESDLWARAPAPFRLDAGRLRAAEAQGVGAATRVTALSEADALRLTELSGRTIHVIPAPFPSFLPLFPEPLVGRPACVLFAGGSWWPNREGARWFVREVWPSIRAHVPGAVLHVFGAGTGPGVQAHPPPRDSREVFAPDSILMVPVRVASGVRIRILEAWARGIPVIATPEGAEGLGARDGIEVLLARTPEEFGEAVLRLGDPSLRLALTEGGRALLRLRHDPREVAGQLLDLYEDALS